MKRKIFIFFSFKKKRDGSRQSVAQGRVPSPTFEFLIKFCVFLCRKNVNRSIGKLPAQVAQLWSSSPQLCRDFVALGIVRRCFIGDFLRSSRRCSSLRPGVLFLLSKSHISDLPLWSKHQCSDNRGEQIK